MLLACGWQVFFKLVASHLLPSLAADLGFIFGARQSVVEAFSPLSCRLLCRDAVERPQAVYPPSWSRASLAVDCFVGPNILTSVFSLALRNVSSPAPGFVWLTPRILIAFFYICNCRYTRFGDAFPAHGPPRLSTRLGIRLRISALASLLFVAWSCLTSGIRTFWLRRFDAPSIRASSWGFPPSFLRHMTHSASHTRGLWSDFLAGWLLFAHTIQHLRFQLMAGFDLLGYSSTAILGYCVRRFLKLVVSLSDNAAISGGFA